MPLKYSSFDRLIQLSGIYIMKHTKMNIWECYVFYNNFF